MYVLIDTERMLLVHKHDDLQVITNLAWIECQNTSYHIFPLDDASGFRHFTDMELGLLYKAVTTGTQSELTGYKVTFNRLQLIQIIYDLCQRVAATDAVLKETEIQAEQIKEGDSQNWLYAKGSKRPGIKPQLFEFKSKCTVKSQDEEARALRGELPALERPKAAAGSPTTEFKPLTRTKRQRAVKKAPEQGTAEAKIWAICNAMWEEAGKPTEQSEIDKLRTKVSPVLVGKGFNQITVLCQFTEWFKSLNFSA